VKAKGKRQEAKDKGQGGKGKGQVKKRPLTLSPLPFSPRRRRELSVTVVGAGRLGTALARALDACGYDVRALIARTSASARRSASRAGVKSVALGVGRVGELARADVLFISTPDDAVAETAERIAALPRVLARVVLHTSGALSSDALAPLRARGYKVGSMHPLVAVSDTEAGAESLRRAFYCVEGDAAAVRAARRVVRDLGGRSFSVRARDKALYHASALMTAGHTVALFDIAAALLARCGLSQSEARRVLFPLLVSAVENLSRQTPERALTGTFARADAETVRKHLAALRETGDTEALLTYALLGGRSLRLAARQGDADAARLKEIARLLAGAFGVE
jgi:predicted short-subunit dehydrogenase-like oxidoreductase (DUF2520 family)